MQRMHTYNYKAKLVETNIEYKNRQVTNIHTSFIDEKEIDPGVNFFFQDDRIVEECQSLIDSNITYLHEWPDVKDIQKTKFKCIQTGLDLPGIKVLGKGYIATFHVHLDTI